MSKNQEHYGDESIVLPEQKNKLEIPKQYQVLLMNDDYTPMEFVVHILESFFSIPHEKATQIMYEVHTAGKGVCGVFTRDIAETRVQQVNDYSRENEHPLMCTMQEV